MNSFAQRRITPLKTPAAVLLKPWRRCTQTSACPYWDQEPLPPYSISPVEQPWRLVSPSSSPATVGLPLFTGGEREHCPSGHIHSPENRGHGGPGACSGQGCPHSWSSSLQISLGDVMKNRVVDEVGTAHPAPGFPGTPCQCTALACHFSHLALGCTHVHSQG